MNVILKEKLVSDDVVSRAYKKVDSIASSKGMTREEFIAWSDKQRYRTSITDYEYQLIHAYQTKKVIDRLEGERVRVNRDVWDRYLYMNGRIKDFKDIEKAIKHLTEVCGYLNSKGITYEHEWLLDDDNLYNQVIDDNNNKSKSNPKSRFKRN